MRELLQTALVLTNSQNTETVDMLAGLAELGLKTIVAPFECDEFVADAVSHILPAQRTRQEALVAGIRYIRESFSGDYVCVIVDADAFHTPISAKLIADEATLHPDTLIFSRQSQKEKNFTDRFVGIAKHILYKRYVGIDVYGESGCLKGFSNRLLPFFEDLQDNHFENDINFLIECRDHDIPIMEIKTKSNKPTGNTHWMDVIEDAVRRHKNVIKFSCSSFIAFLIDYLVYSLILIIGAHRINVLSLTYANIAARIISSTVNFNINRKFVFKSVESLRKSAAQFYTLAAVILAGNSVVLNFLANGLGINHYLAKIITEMTFFALNWTIQNFVIFRKKS